MGKSVKRFSQYLQESDIRKNLLKKASSSASDLEKLANEKILIVSPPQDEYDIAVVTPGTLMQSEIDSEGYPTGNVINTINDPGVMALAQKVQKNMDDLLGVTERKKREQEFLKKRLNSINPSDPTLG